MINGYRLVVRDLEKLTEMVLAENRSCVVLRERPLGELHPALDYKIPKVHQLVIYGFDSKGEYCHYHTNGFGKWSDGDSYWALIGYGHIKFRRVNEKKSVNIKVDRYRYDPLDMKYRLVIEMPNTSQVVNNLAEFDHFMCQFDNISITAGAWHVLKTWRSNNVDKITNHLQEALKTLR